MPSRYLMQRQRLPHETPILVGMWPSEHSLLRGESIQAAIGADDYTSSPGYAVTTCSNAAREAGDLSQTQGSPDFPERQPPVLPRVA